MSSFWKKFIIFYAFVFILSFFNQSISDKVIFLRSSAELARLNIELTAETTNEPPLAGEEYTPIENFWFYITGGINVALCFLIILVAHLIVIIIMAVCLVIGVILSIILFIVLGVIYLFGARQAFGWIEFEHLFLWHFLPPWDWPFHPLLDITNIMVWIGKVIFIIINNIPLFLLFYISLALISFSIRKIKLYPVRLKRINKEEFSKLSKYFEKIHQWEKEGYDTTEIREFFKKQGINIE